MHAAAIALRHSHVTDNHRLTAHSLCDVTHVVSSAAGRATVSHLAIIVVYIEFA